MSFLGYADLPGGRCPRCDELDRVTLEECVRDMPEEAAQVLRHLGYTVTRPSDITMARAPVWSSTPREVR